MTRSPKKSEMLELRLSHPDKSALQQKAAKEGRSVSAVVRGLITDYLVEPDDLAKAHPLRRSFMFLIQRPKTVIGVTALALASSFAASSSANYQNVLIAVEAAQSAPTPWTKSTAFFRQHNESTCLYLERAPRTCDLANLRPNLLAATFDVIRHDDHWAIDITVRRGEDIHETERLELRPEDGGSFATDTPDGYEINILAVINEDESRTIPEPLEKL